MSFKRTLLAGLVAVTTAISVAGAASADPTWDARHPRQAQVLDRAAHERGLIRQDRREGELSSFKAHRLLVRDRRIVREERLMARHHHRITRREQLRLDRQEGRLRHGIPG
jgi:hypothetical protein